jgi:hypothetical protein
MPSWIGLDRGHRELAALSPAEQLEIGPLIPPRDIAHAVSTLLEEGQAGKIVYMLRVGEWIRPRGR